MAAALQHLGSCSFCGHPLWPTTGELSTDDHGDHLIELECMIGESAECTRGEFKITEIFGE